MMSETAQLHVTRTEMTDRDVAYREDFVRLLARLEVEPAEAIALVEAGAGRPFETCSPTHLLPLLEQLLELVHSHRNPVEARPPWRV